MTRRERHIFVLKSHGGLNGGRTRQTFNQITARGGFDAFPDDFLEHWARTVLEDYQRSNRMNEANRRICGA